MVKEAEGPSAPVLRKAWKQQKGRGHGRSQMILVRREEVGRGINVGGRGGGRHLLESFCFKR